MSSNPIITFTSDFGRREYYVGAVQGVILNICPQARIVEVSHELSPHNVLQAAFTLLATYSCYPAETVHLAVVDPGVGSERRGIVVSTGRYHLVGPDNGIFSMICQREEIERVVSIESETYFRKPVSSTFHGRDIFGPVAAWLACGTDVREFGPEVEDYRQLDLPGPRKVGDQIEGLILQVDHFGNAITNISADKVQDLFPSGSPHRFFVGGREITAHYRFYAEAGEDEVFFLLGSSGFYEVAARGQSAANLLDLTEGAPVTIEVT